MNEPLECPSAEVLEQFLRGELDPAYQKRISEHLDRCLACAAAVEAAGTRTYSLHAVSPKSPTVPAGKEAPTVVVSREGDDEDASPLEYLDPPLNEKAMGRIGRYDVFDVLGRGGYGIVFRGFDEQLRRPIAIKVLARSLAWSEQARRRFIREARAAAIINHPNVVTIHAVEEHRGMPFLVMELITGGSLRDRIRDGPKPGPVELVRVAAQIASGLAAAHAQGIIHRDIKPGNVMLENGIERLKITDFGLARVALDNVDLTSRELAVGTPAYMAPEQVSGGEVDSRTDLFALGCVIYAMVTGHSPFQGRSALEIARRVHDDHPPPLCEIDKSVPRFLSEITEKLLQKDPNQRFQSAAEVASILNSHLTILNQTPTDELPKALNRPLAKPPLRGKSSRARRALVAVTSAVLLTAVFFGWRRWTNQEEESNRPPEAPQAAAALPGTPNRPEAAPASPPVPPLLARVAVSQEGAGDCSTLTQALARVAPGGLIEIVDGGVYSESLLIDSAARWRDVQIVSTSGASLQNEARTPVVTIRGVAGLTIRGLRLVARHEQHAVVLDGPCPGARLESLAIGRTANHSSAAYVAAIHVRPGAGGTQEQPIAIRGVTVYDTVVGVVVGNQHSPEPSEWITIEGCRVHGASSGFLLVLFPGAGRVHVERSVFDGGLCAVSVVASDEFAFEDIVYAHNTIHRCQSWILWRNADEQPQPMSAVHEITFRNNLLLDVHDTAAPSTANAAGWFSNNVWRADSQTNAEHAGRVAQVVTQLPLKSEERDDPDYLTPDVERLRNVVGDDAPLPGHFVPQQP